MLKRLIEETRARLNKFFSSDDDKIPYDKFSKAEYPDDKFSIGEYKEHGASPQVSIRDGSGNPLGGSRKNRGVRESLDRRETDDEYVERRSLGAVSPRGAVSPDEARLHLARRKEMEALLRAQEEKDRKAEAGSTKFVLGAAGLPPVVTGPQTATPEQKAAQHADPGTGYDPDAKPAGLSRPTAPLPQGPNIINPGLTRPSEPLPTGPNKMAGDEEEPGPSRPKGP